MPAAEKLPGGKVQAPWDAGTGPLLATARFFFSEMPGRRLPVRPGLIRGFQASALTASGCNDGIGHFAQGPPGCRGATHAGARRKGRGEGIQLREARSIAAMPEEEVARAGGQAGEQAGTPVTTIGSGQDTAALKLEHGCATAGNAAGGEAGWWCGVSLGCHVFGRPDPGWRLTAGLALAGGPCSGWRGRRLEGRRVLGGGGGVSR